MWLNEGPHILIIYNMFKGIALRWWDLRELLASFLSNQIKSYYRAMLELFRCFRMHKRGGEKDESWIFWTRDSTKMFLMYIHKSSRINSKVSSPNSTRKRISSVQFYLNNPWYMLIAVKEPSIFKDHRIYQQKIICILKYWISNQV